MLDNQSFQDSFYYVRFQSESLNDLSIFRKMKKQLNIPYNSYWEIGDYSKNKINIHNTNCITFKIYNSEHNDIHSNLLTFLNEHVTFLSFIQNSIQIIIDFVAKPYLLKKQKKIEYIINSDVFKYCFINNVSYNIYPYFNQKYDDFDEYNVQSTCKITAYYIHDINNSSLLDKTINYFSKDYNFKWPIFSSIEFFDDFITETAKNELQNQIKFISIECYLYHAENPEISFSKKSLKFLSEKNISVKMELIPVE